MGTERPRIMIDVDQETKRLVKANAAMEGLSVRQWVTQAVESKLYNEPTVQFSAVGTKRKVRTG
jgi:hypothetical protein